MDDQREGILGTCPVAAGHPLVWDNHFCLPMDLAANRSALQRLSEVHSAGVDVVSINTGFGAMEWAEHIRLIAQMRRFLSVESDDFVLVDSVSDIRAAKDSNRLAVVFDIEGAHVAESQLDFVQLFYDLGVRWMLIAYNRNNAIGGGCHDRDSGLTPLGRRVVDELARVGMVACCSHTGYRTAREVLAHSNNPVIFSHSNPYSMCAHPRNIPDDLIIACAESGGVVGITGVSIFLGDGAATPARVAEHVDYVVELVGIDHVGLSSDFAPTEGALQEELASMEDYFPPGYGYDDVHILPPTLFSRVARDLLQKGYAAEDVTKVLGGNFLRIADTVWR